MKMTRTFVWSEGTEGSGGEPGWLPAWIGKQAGFDPGFDIGVPHDMLEHRLCDTGEFWQEIMAFGAMIFTRWENSYWINTYFKDKPSFMGEELFRLYLDAQKPNIPEAPAITRSSHERFLAFARGFKTAAEENEYIESDETVHRIAGWMAYGYAHAARRFHFLSQWTLVDLFKDIGKLCWDRARLIAEDYGPGTRLRITIEANNGLPRLRSSLRDAYGREL